jgi:hypothetical protein
MSLLRVHADEAALPRRGVPHPTPRVDATVRPEGVGNGIDNVIEAR